MYIQHSGAVSWIRRVLRCRCHQHLLGCRVHTWSGFQRLCSRILLAPAAARSATSFYDQWLHRLPVQSTLSAAVSCIPAFWFHGASHLVRIFILKPTGPRSIVTTESWCWWVVRLAAVKSVSANEWHNISSFSVSVAILDPWNITGHQLQHGAMSHWQHQRESIEVKAMPNLEQPLSASNNKFVTLPEATSSKVFFIK